MGALSGTAAELGASELGAVSEVYRCNSNLVTMEVIVSAMESREASACCAFLVFTVPLRNLKDILRILASRANALAI